MVGPRWAHSSVPGLLYWADHRDRLGDQARSVGQVARAITGTVPPRDPALGVTRGRGSRHGGVTRGRGSWPPQKVDVLFHDDRGARRRGSSFTAFIRKGKQKGSKKNVPVLPCFHAGRLSNVTPAVFRFARLLFTRPLFTRLLFKW